MTFGSQVVGFINEDPPIAGEPLSEVQRKAVDMKIDEDILLAREFIEIGGDYRRALSILEGLKPLAPDNTRLAEEIANAEAMRYVTEERFEAIKKGMTEDEVREVLGPVNLRNVKEYPDRNVTAWFYKRENGGAAGIYFQERKGKLVTYKFDFNAVNPEDGEGD